MLFVCTFLSRKKLSFVIVFCFVFCITLFILSWWVFWPSPFSTGFAEDLLSCRHSWLKLLCEEILSSENKGEKQRFIPVKPNSHAVQTHTNRQKAVKLPDTTWLLKTASLQPEPKTKTFVREKIFQRREDEDAAANKASQWRPYCHVLDNICDGAPEIEFLDGCPLLYETPVPYLPLICQDRSMQTLELPIHTMSSVCPPSWCNLSVQSEPHKINKWNPNQKCHPPLDGRQRGRPIRPDLILFPNHMMHSDN